MKHNEVYEVEGLLQDALALHRNSRPEDALPLYERIISIHPVHINALHLYATLQTQSGLVSLALLFFDQALKINKKNAHIFSTGGSLYMERGD
jgi:tetratricopeptide (TPR) repeat protein